MNLRRRILASILVLASALAIVDGVAVAASSPSVVTGATSNVGQTSALLKGTVNPNGAQTSYWFEWGTTTAYGNNAPWQMAGYGSHGVPVHWEAARLTPGTVYHYRLVAASYEGTSYGRDHTFKTAGHPPSTAVTGSTTGTTSSSTTLTGSINPHGEATSWSFQYGTSTHYGSYTTGGTVPAGSTPVGVASALQGLEPATIFHYRLVARHGSAIVSYGADATFMTYPAIRSRPQMTARVRPHHAKHKPFTFTTRGKVMGLGRFPAAYSCTGLVSVRFFLGRKRVAVTTVPLQPNCTYAAQTVFNRRPGRGKPGRQVHLAVFVRFLGNGYLAPAHSHSKTVILG